MKLSVLFTINAVVAVLFGIGFILIPAPLLSLYAVETNAAGLYLARLLGAAFLGFGLVSWLVKDGSGPEQRALVLALCLSELLGFAASLMNQLQGTANVLGWSTVAIYLLLGLGFGYFYMKKP